MNPLRITGGRALLPGFGFAETDLSLANGRIARIGASRAGPELDATGLLVLPGIVDLHGDAFERQLQPRPGINFPASLALADTEAQLLANGITTAYHGLTLSWEPGLRGLEAWRAFIAALDALHGRRVCDMRVHLRWEAFNLDALDEAIADIEAGRVGLLAFNDHTPGILKKLDQPGGHAYGKRAGVPHAAFKVLAERAASRGAEIEEGIARIAAAARKAGLPMASHDDDTAASRERFRSLGARICEFPMAEEVGIAARAAGDFVVMGAPNVVRGGSHIGWASATELIGSGICNVLASDYFYPALLQAPFLLAARANLDLAAAWELVAGNPAAAAGLTDRGRIAPGLRADLLLVDPSPPQPHLVATLAGGRVAWLSGCWLGPAAFSRGDGDRTRQLNSLHVQRRPDRRAISRTQSCRRRERSECRASAPRRGDPAP